VVEANIPLSEKIVGYDSAKLRSLIDFVFETMEKIQAEKAEIYPLGEPDVGYMVPRNLTVNRQMPMAHKLVAMSQWSVFLEYVRKSQLSSHGNGTFHQYSRIPHQKADTHEQNRSNSRLAGFVDRLRPIVAPKRGLVLDHSRRQRRTALDHIDLRAIPKIELDILRARHAAGKKGRAIVRERKEAARSGAWIFDDPFGDIPGQGSSRRRVDSDVGR
jgi:hypothetical protein